MSNLVYLYVGGVLVSLLNVRNAGSLNIQTVTNSFVWPVYAVSDIYEIVAPAVKAVVSYVVELINKIRGK
jgi:hypothetical protein